MEDMSKKYSFLNITLNLLLITHICQLFKTNSLSPRIVL